VTATVPKAPPDPLLPARDALLPVREALLARAEAEAQRLLAKVDAEADAIIARAQVEADTIRAEARAQGEADAAEVLVGQRARARRQARAVVLAAQRETYDELRSRVVRDLPALRADPAYAAWRDRRGQDVRAVLGPDAVVTEHPEGGVIGEVAGRRVAYTLTGLADRALDALGSEVEGLWST
jgi:vacuolar-type H+-ATPase subunit H